MKELIQTGGTTEGHAALFSTTAAALFLTLGIILLVYAAISRIAAADFLARGEIHEATVASAEARRVRSFSSQESSPLSVRRAGVSEPGNPAPGFISLDNFARILSASNS